MQLEVEVRLPSLALDILKRIVDQRPEPQTRTDAARMAAQAIANHLILLIHTASDANVKGRHSVAVSLFRNMEDALDCFGAVTLSPGAAERWTTGELKASQATKLYEEKLGPIRLPNGHTTTDYRKDLRSYLNHYAHCTPFLIDWDLYPHFEPQAIRQLANHELDANIQSELRVNTRCDLLVQNGIRIGAFLAAHTLEFLRLTCMGYEDFLRSDEQLQTEVIHITARLEDFLKTNWAAVYLETPPPEIKTPRIQHPDDPTVFMELHLPDAAVGMSNPRVHADTLRREDTDHDERNH